MRTSKIIEFKGVVTFTVVEHIFAVKFQPFQQQFTLIKIFCKSERFCLADFTTVSAILTKRKWFETWFVLGLNRAERAG